uniref:Uncharacterized protein n=1 Tax=Felis catus TaxID=9685 RepID=A0ABI7YN27_FELCA
MHGFIPIPGTLPHRQEGAKFPAGLQKRQTDSHTKEGLRVHMEKEFPGVLENQVLRPWTKQAMDPDQNGRGKGSSQSSFWLTAGLTSHAMTFVAHTKQKGKTQTAPGITPSPPTQGPLSGGALQESAPQLPPPPPRVKDPPKMCK